MSEFAKWFEETFKECYCEQRGLIDEKRFAELVQLILDNEADEKSRALFEHKIKTCIKSSNCFENERCIQEAIKDKLVEHKSVIPNDLVMSIKKSINL